MDWAGFQVLVFEIVCRNQSTSAVYGVPTGGSLVALDVARRLNVPMIDQPTEPAPGLLVVDDLVDSGRTLRPWVDQGYRVDTLIRKPHSPTDIAPEASEVSGWVQFPWEHTGQPEDAVIRLIEHVGENPNREGLRDTPGRVCRAMREMTSGYQQKPEELLSKTFDVTFDEMVVLRGIRFTSLCEHHLLPFTGTADVGYIPAKQVVGISKLARLVECFARRLQVQERMTLQIAQAINDYLKPQGVGVVVRAQHQCMGCRGVRQPDADMVTSAMLGIMRDDNKARGEMLALCH